MKFGTQLGYTLCNNLRYKGIPNFAHIQNGGHFSKWPPMCYLEIVFTIKMQVVGVFI
jgi:hypothetical protein